MVLRFNIIQKLLGFLLLASILPLLVVGGTSYHVARATLQEQATSYTAELVDNQKDYLELQLQEVDSLIANISGVEAIIQALDDTANVADVYTNLATQARIGYILDGYTNLRGLVSIDLFSMNNLHYHVGDTLDVSNIRTDVKTQIMTQALQARQQIVWTGIEDNVNTNSTSKKVITAAKILSRTDSHTLQSRSVGLLLVNYSVDEFYDHFYHVDLGKGAYLMVIDAQNRIIYHPDKRFWGARVNSTFVQKLTRASGTFTDSIDGHTMIVTYAHSDLSDWVVLSFIPVETLMAQTTTIGMTTLVVLLAAFVVVALSAWLVSRKMVTPIQQITYRFKLLQDGAYDPQTPLAVTGHDEIGDLITWFNTFLESMKVKQQTEAALRASEERYRSLVELAPVPIVVHNAGKIIYINPTGAQTLAATDPEELIGTSLLERVHPDDCEQVQTRIQQMSAGTYAGATEERFVRLDEQIIDVEFVGIMVTYLDEPAHLVVFHDITERKQMERMKNEFISVVSHELRTPLTAIRGSLGLIHGGVMGGMPMQARTMVDIAYQNSERLVRLVNDILDMEKIQSGKLEFNMAPVALMPLIEQTITANQAYAIEFNVQFTLEQTLSSDVMVNVDSDRLIQVLTNLLSNAAKFSPPNDVVIVNVSRQQQVVRVAVSDHGPGIPEAFRARVFQKFAQADSSDRRQKGGTGLGLSISKAIIERMGGQIGFETMTGVGSTFYVDLPKHIEAEDCHSTLQHGELSESVVRYNGWKH